MIVLVHHIHSDKTFRFEGTTGELKRDIISRYGELAGLEVLADKPLLMVLRKLDHSQVFDVRTDWDALKAEAEQIAAQKLQAITQGLQKAMRGEDIQLFDSVKRAADHRPHIVRHPITVDPTPFREKVVESKEPVEPTMKVTGTNADMDPFLGAAKKAVYQVGDNTYMVKPYHQDKGYPYPGWSEMANQALYHAAGIGNLHQKVHTDEVEHNPVTVTHFDKELLPLYKHGDLEKRIVSNQLPLSRQAREDLSKIYLMDFLTNNSDRHSGNIMTNKDGSRWMAIDHGNSFWYGANPSIERFFRNVSFPKNVAMTEHRVKEFPRHTLEWWGRNARAVKEEFARHLPMLYDPHRLSVERNFMDRVAYLDQLRSKL